MMFHVLQHLVMPNLTFGAPEEMYARVSNENARLLLNDHKVNFREGGKLSFDTFFNSMTVGTWRKHCTLDDLHLVLSGSGKFVLRFGMHRVGHAHRWLDEQIIELREGQEVSNELTFWSKLDGGMLYFSLEALGEASLSGGYLATTTTPVHDVKLGIVITHFNRKQYVLPAIKRIREELLNDPLYKGKIELVVVDNSKNITSEEAKGITLLPNKNLGGSGGFTRGLLYLKDEGSFTHCLFMDDDASCEVESIKRAYSMLQHAKTPKFAFAGSLMRELEPYRLFEKGATFIGVCSGLKTGMDMRHVQDILYAELIDNKPNYGAWWFFAFSIKDVKSYAFPFFVRGDDILFGISNGFDIATLNGVGCWGEDFGLKSGPMPRYLDVRNHIVQRFVNFDMSRLSTLKLISQFFLTPLFSYDYSSAKAARLALIHASMGPSFWVDNIDMGRIRALIGAFAGSEKLAPVDRAKLNVQYSSPHETKFRFFFRTITLNGFLLPTFMLKDGVVFQHKRFRATFREIFRYKKVLYEYEPMGVGYVAEHDKIKFFSELMSFSWQLLKFAVRFNTLKLEYQAALLEMTSESFWRKVYADD